MGASFCWVRFGGRGTYTCSIMLISSINHQQLNQWGNYQHKIATELTREVLHSAKIWTTRGHSVPFGACGIQINRHVPFMATGDIPRLEGIGAVRSVLIQNRCSRCSHCRLSWIRTQESLPVTDRSYRLRTGVQVHLPKKYSRCTSHVQVLCLQSWNSLVGDSWSCTCLRQNGVSRGPVATTLQ